MLQQGSPGAGGTLRVELRAVEVLTPYNGTERLAVDSSGQCPGAERRSE